jgi:hypothetical protein
VIQCFRSVGILDLGECNRVVVLCTSFIEQAEELWRVVFFYSYLELEVMKCLGEWEERHLVRSHLTSRPHDR